MLSLTRSTDYALVALAHLARHAPDQSKAESARAIAEKYEMPGSLLMNLMKQLHKAEIIGSTRGACGGYYLAKPPETITLDAIVTAIEGPVQMALCCDENDGDEEGCTTCRVLPGCPIKTSIAQLSEAMTALLASITVRDLLEGTVAEAIRENMTHWTDTIPVLAPSSPVAVNIHATRNR